MTPVQQYPALTSVRGIAAWWIVLYHFREVAETSLPGWAVSAAAEGYLAVDLFFQLSGFVIALNYGARFSGFRLAGTAEFLMLRLARIYPLHLFMMVLFLLNPLGIMLFSASSELGERYDPAYWFMNLLLIQNWGFSGWSGWNFPAWSVSTEWFAYLMFPLLAALVARLANLRQALAAAIVLLLTLAWVTPWFGPSLGSNIPQFGLVRCVLQFMLGMCLFRLREHHAFRGGFAPALGLCLAVGCFAVTAVFQVPDYVLTPLGFSLLILSLTDKTSVAARLLDNRLLGAIGTVSYSTYMVHYFIKDWLKFLLMGHGVPQFVLLAAYLLLTACASAVLYRWIEVPGRSLVRAAARGGFPVARSKVMP